MGVAASNRGTRSIARDADALMAAPLARADRQAHKDEIERLKAQIASLSHDLSRARRCLASERHGREQLRLRLAAEERSSAFATSTLCRIAFPCDAAPTGGGE